MKIMNRLNLLAEAVAFTPLGMLLGVLFGVTATIVVVQSLRPTPLEPQTAVIVTVPAPTETAVRVPTQSPPTPMPQATATPEPTSRPKGANYIVKDGDNMINIVKHVCRGLGYELFDQYLIADLAEMNRKHNEQAGYIGAVLQPNEEVGIGCVLP